MKIVSKDGKQELTIPDDQKGNFIGKGWEEKKDKKEVKDGKKK